MHPAGFELATCGLGNRCSILLSYGCDCLRKSSRRGYVRKAATGYGPDVNAVDNRKHPTSYGRTKRHFVETVSKPETHEPDALFVVRCSIGYNSLVRAACGNPL